VVQDRGAHLGQDRAQGVGFVFRDAGEVVLEVFAAARFFQGLDRGQSLHERFRRRARLRDDEEARRAQVRHLQPAAKDAAVEAVDDEEARAADARGVGGRAPEGELRQRLRAQARTAGAEQHEVGRVLGQVIDHGPCGDEVF
jgi:hypothetical protein